MGFLEEYKSILTSKKDLMFVPMSLTYIKKVADQVRILEVRHSLYTNDQNKISWTYELRKIW